MGGQDIEIGDERDIEGVEGLLNWRCTELRSNRWGEMRWRGSGHHRGAISGGAAFTVAGIDPRIVT